MKTQKIDFPPEFKDLTLNHKYIITEWEKNEEENGNGAENDIITNFVRTLVVSNKKPEHQIDRVEYSLIRDFSTIEYDKKTKQYPLFSSISIPADGGRREPILLADIEIEDYKYKTLKETLDADIFIPVEYNHIIFEGGKFHKNIRHPETDTPETHGAIYLNYLNYLKINVWGVSAPIISVPREAGENAIVMVEDRIINKVIYTPQPPTQLNEFILKLKSTEMKTPIVSVRFMNYENPTERLLLDKYGDLTDDIKPFILWRDTENPSILTTNRFFKNRVLQKILSKDICYWIINECEKQMNKKEWNVSPRINYDRYISLETLPAVMSFILFISNFWLNYIKNDYEMKAVELNIKDIFITKYFEGSKNTNQNKDNYFLSLNIQLNDTIDFIGGNIGFDDNSDILLQQGDMLIFNGEKKRTNGGIVSGQKYMLVFLLEIKE